MNHFFWSRGVVKVIAVASFGGGHYTKAKSPWRGVPNRPCTFVFCRHDLNRRIATKIISIMCVLIELACKCIKTEYTYKTCELTTPKSGHIRMLQTFLYRFSTCQDLSEAILLLWRQSWDHGFDLRLGPGQIISSPSSPYRCSTQPRYLRSNTEDGASCRGCSWRGKATENGLKQTSATETAHWTSKHRAITSEAWLLTRWQHKFNTCHNRWKSVIVLSSHHWCSIAKDHQPYIVGY